MALAPPPLRPPRIKTHRGDGDGVTNSPDRPISVSRPPNRGWTTVLLFLVNQNIIMVECASDICEFYTRIISIEAIIIVSAIIKLPMYNLVSPAGPHIRVMPPVLYGVDINRERGELFTRLHVRSMRFVFKF